MFEIISHLMTLLVGTLMYGASIVVGGVGGIYIIWRIQYGNRNFDLMKYKRIVAYIWVISGSLLFLYLEPEWRPELLTIIEGYEWNSIAFMAELVECPTCHQKVSTNARSCPSCGECKGYPFEKNTEVT